MISLKKHLLVSESLQAFDLRFGQAMARAGAMEALHLGLDHYVALKTHPAMGWVFRNGVTKPAFAVIGGLNASLRPAVIASAVGLGLAIGLFTASPILPIVFLALKIAFGTGLGLSGMALYGLAPLMHGRYIKAVSLVVQKGRENPTIFDNALPRVWKEMGFLPVDCRSNPISLTERIEYVEGKNLAVELRSKRALSPCTPGWLGFSTRLLRRDYLAPTFHFLDARLAVDIAILDYLKANENSNNSHFDRIVSSLADVTMDLFRTSVKITGWENIQAAVDAGFLKIPTPRPGSRRFVPKLLLEELDSQASPSRTPFILFADHSSTWELPLHVDIFAALQARQMAKKEFFKEGGFLDTVFGPALKAFGFFSIDRSDHQKGMQTIKKLGEQIVRGEMPGSFLFYPNGTRNTGPAGRDGPLSPSRFGGVWGLFETAGEAYGAVYGQRGIGAMAPRNSEIAIPLLCPPGVLGIPIVGKLGTVFQMKDLKARATAGLPDIKVKEQQIALAAEIDRQMSELSGRPVSQRPHFRFQWMQRLRKIIGA